MADLPLAVGVLGRGLVDPALPSVRVDDEAVTRGRAAFETLRVYGGRPFRLDDHLARLARSAVALGLEAPHAAALEALAHEAITAGGRPDAVLRFYWTPGPPGEGSQGYVLVSEIPSWIEAARTTGQRLAALSFPRRSDTWLLPGVKSTSYATHIAAEEEAKRRGADDAVLVDVDGVVLEGPVTNVWWREGEKTLVTPSLELGILAGETRAALLEVADGLGYAVEMGAFPLARLLSAEEVFTSSSVREVMPVVSVDSATFALGTAAATMQRTLRRLAIQGI
ncbi:MAG: aminotransferase class IV [Gaiellales bacterium]